MQRESSLRAHRTDRSALDKVFFAGGVCAYQITLSLGAPNARWAITRVFIITERVNSPVTHVCQQSSQSGTANGRARHRRRCRRRRQGLREEMAQPRLQGLSN